jgi:NTE family protein
VGTGTKIGLTLSSGVALGLAHIGVLKALEEEGIPVDMISGTSIGALVGAWYAKEGDAATLEEIASEINWKEEALLVDLNIALMWKGLIQGQKIKSLLIQLIGDVEFKDLKIPFAAIATDAQSMEEIVIDEGSVIEALRASISIPAIFTPAKWQGRFLIDGGIVNPMPVDVVRKMGADKVIASNTAVVTKRNIVHTMQLHEKEKNAISSQLHTDRSHLLSIKQKINSLMQENKDRAKAIDEFSQKARKRFQSPSSSKIDTQTPNMFEVLTQSLHAMQYEKILRSAKLADVVINPDVSNIGTFDFFRAEEAIHQGYKATKEILPEIRKKIYSPPS